MENSAATSSRFANSLSETELKNLIDETRAPNSIKKANWAIKIFNQWLENRKKEGIINGLHCFKTICEMSKGELNSQLQYFIFEVRKVNGEAYPANSLRDLFQGIGYYMFHIENKPFKLFSDAEFLDSRKALDAAMKKATKDGIEPCGNGAASPITQEQEEILWAKGILGEIDSKTLINTIFYLSGKFFALRGGTEHRELQWNVHVKLIETENCEMLVYNSQLAKNYNGGLQHTNIKPKQVKVFPNIENTG